MIFDLTGRTVCVIGAAGGIGEAVCNGLTDLGASVLCVDRDAARLRRLSAQLRRREASSVALVCDLEHASDRARFASECRAIDGLVSLVGCNIRKRIIELSDEEFDTVQSSNLTVTFQLLRDVGHQMAQARCGSIVVFSSIRATVTEPGQGAYAAAKAGIEMLVKTFAAELGPVGVRVNAIAPSLVSTPFASNVLSDPAWSAAYRDKTALQRLARPEDLVGPVAFLLSDASAFVTGSSLLVDGGWSAIDGRFDPPL